MRSALITGGAGFIGAHLARNLARRGVAVDLVDNFSRGIRDRELGALVTEPNVRLFDEDLLRQSTFDRLPDGHTFIFHFAAIIGVANVVRRPQAVLTENVQLLANVLDFARRQRSLERLVFASTSEVYAGTLQYFELPIPTPEDTPLAVTDLSHPRTSYMLSKIYGEAMCYHSGVPFTIVRPHNVYGPRMGTAHVIPQLLQRAYESEINGSLEVFSPEHRRVFCYIDDAVGMLTAIAGSPDALGQVLNLGSTGPEVTMKELATLVCDVVGKRLQIVEREDTPGSPRRRCPDMTRTISVVGPRPQVDLREGVMRTAEWYREHFATSAAPARS